MMIEEKRLEWVDKMRGIAILSVVIQHLTYCYQNEFIYHKLIAISNMGVFFFISGFIWNKTAHINNIKDAIIYFIKKTIQILVPFISWTFFMHTYCFQKNWQVWSISQIIHEFREPHLWFLLSLYGYSFYFIIYKIVNKYIGFKLSILFWLFSFCVLGIIWYEFKWFKMEVLYMPYFVMGVIFSQDKTIDKIFSNKIITTLSLFCIFTLLVFWESGHTSIINILIKLIISFSIILIIYLICKNDNWNQFISIFIMNCGKDSLAIYVMHWSFLKLLETKYLIVQNELLAFIPILLFSILICYVCIFFRKIISYSPFFDTILLGNTHNINIKF